MYKTESNKVFHRIGGWFMYIMRMDSWKMKRQDPQKGIRNFVPEVFDYVFSREEATRKKAIWTRDACFF